MPIRSTLITTAAVVLTAWSLATSAQGQPDKPSGGGSPSLQVAVPPAADLLVVEVPPLPPPLIDPPPSAAREAPSPTTLVAAPAAEAPTTANSPPSAAAGAATSVTRPSSSGQPRRTEARSAKPRAVGPALILLNARESPVVSVTVTAGDTTVRQTRLVGPNARATFALPKAVGCAVAIEAVYEDGGASEVRSIDACKIKLVRLTD